MTNRLTLTDLANLQNEQTAVSTINNNNSRIEAVVEDTLSRSGIAPNEMESNLDMNSYRIYNLPSAVGNTEPVRLAEFEQAISDIVGGAVFSPSSISDANLAILDTRSGDLDVTTQLAVVTVSPNLDIVRTGGYSATGDGGAQMLHNIAAPSVAKRWQHQDASGKWYELSANEFYPEMFGHASSWQAIFTDMMTVDTNGAGRRIWLTPGKTYIIDSATVPIIANTTIMGYGSNVTSTGTVASKAVPIFKATAVDNFSVYGGTYTGIGYATDMDNVIQGLITMKASGLVTRPKNFKVRDVEVTNAASLIAAYGIENVLVESCNLHDWQTFGVLGSGCKNIRVNGNKFLDSHFGATHGATYAVHATGGPTASAWDMENLILTNNWVENISDWDAFGSEGTKNIVCIGNIIKNVRTGIDFSIGDPNAAAGVGQPIERVIISNNYIEGTTTDTFGGAAGSHYPIQVLGSAPNPCITVNINNNVCRSFFKTFGGSAVERAGIRVYFAQQCSINNNQLTDMGTNGGSGILLNADAAFAHVWQMVNVNNNIMKGTFPDGGVRAVNFKAEQVAINGNVIGQANTSHVGIELDGDSVSSLTARGNASNSLVPYSTTLANGTTRHLSDYPVTKTLTTTGVNQTLNLSNCDQVDLTSASAVNYNAVSGVIVGKIYAICAQNGNTTLTHTANKILTAAAADITPNAADVLLFYGSSTTCINQVAARIDVS